MPAELKRLYGKGHLHFVTFSCYRRLPLLKTAGGASISGSWHFMLVSTYRLQAINNRLTFLGAHSVLCLV